MRNKLKNHWTDTTDGKEYIKFFEAYAESKSEADYQKLSDFLTSKGYNHASLDTGHNAYFMHRDHMTKNWLWFESRKMYEQWLMSHLDACNRYYTNG